MPVVLEECGWEEIEAFVPMTKGTMLTFSGKTTYYLAKVSGVLVGFCGIVWMESSAKFKNDFIFPKFRGRGYFKEMVAARLEMVRTRGISRVSASCTPMSVRHYVTVGFEPVRRYKNGCTEVVRL